MHAVRTELLRAQAAAADLPLVAGADPLALQQRRVRGGDGGGDGPRARRRHRPRRVRRSLSGGRAPLPRGAPGGDRRDAAVSDLGDADRRAGAPDGRRRAARAPHLRRSQGPRRPLRRARIRRRAARRAAGDGRPLRRARRVPHLRPRRSDVPASGPLPRRRGRHARRLRLRGSACCEDRLPARERHGARARRSDSAIGWSAARTSAIIPPGSNGCRCSAVPRSTSTAPALEIDARVRERLHAGLPLYEVDEAQLAALAPDFIITQTHCEVCAVSPGDLAHGVAAQLERHQVVALATGTVDGILDGFARVAEVLGAAEAGRALVAGFGLAWRHSPPKHDRSRGRGSPASSGSTRCSRWGTGGRRSSRSPAARACSARPARTRRRLPSRRCATPIRR